jgi:diguanylate cyclase (GGDEF)-like protein/PAS domain S-box-containing protein
MPDLENQEICRAILDSLQTGVYVIDTEKKILFWNDGAEKITGYLRHEVVGCYCTDDPNANREGHRAILAEAAEPLAIALRDGKIGIDDISLRHRSGHRINLRVRTVPIRNGHGTIFAAAQSFDDNPSASAWDRRQHRLAGYGCLDATSGVLNKDFTLSQLQKQLATFSEHAVPFSILSIEVDRLDHLRETYGLAVVTSVLQVVAQTLESSLRPTDSLGRVADNRFLAVLAECAQPDIEGTAKRLKKMVSSSEVKWWGDKWPVSASFGGTAVRMGDTVESLLERAEHSLADSLAAGGNQVTVAA